MNKAIFCWVIMFISIALATGVKALCSPLDTGKVIPISRKKHTTRKQPSTMQANNPRREARVELVLDKQEYFLGENILLHYCVNNQGAEPFRVNAGGDYRGDPRHLRFKVVATDAEGKLVEDPYPSIMCMGGLSSGKTLQPGETWWQSLPLMRYCDFHRPGVYKLIVYHDLGWEGFDYWNHIEANVLPQGPHIAPIVETVIKLVLPSKKQAQQVVKHMLTLPRNPNARVGERHREYEDFAAARHPVYLPIVSKLAKRGYEHSLDAIGAMATPEATWMLIQLLGSKHDNISSKAMKLLLKRLPEPKVDKRRWDWANRLRLVGRSWHADMKPAVLNWGWKSLAKNDRKNLMNGAYIIRCLGGKDDFHRFMKILDCGLVAMKDDPVEQHSYPRPPTASAALVDAGWELVERGAKVPTDTRTPGRAVLFMLALGERENFRPSNWEITAAELLKHPIPYVRAIAVKNLPVPLHMSLHEPVLALIKDDYSPVQVQTCNLAAKTESEQFRTPLLDILEETENRWVLRAAYNAALECGVNRDHLLEICVERLADNDLAITLFDLIIKVVEYEGGYGYSQVDWSKVSELKSRWKLLIEDNRDRIRAGQLFKIAEPPLIPDLFPRGFHFQRKNKTSWPEWPKDITTRKSRDKRQETSTRRHYYPDLGYGAYYPYVYTGFDEFLWHLGSGDDKVLWKKTFEFDVDESDAPVIWGDEMTEDTNTRELWLLAKTSLPESSFFGIEAAWLDKQHTTAICILFKTSSEGVEPYEYTNSYAAIVGKTGERFYCRQFVKLWESKEDYNKRERLSLPMHHRFLSQKWRGWPKYSHAKVAALDMDGDLDKDLVVNLWYSGGSYAGAETFVLRNNSGIYTIVLSKKGAESQRFGTKAKPITRITDLDSDGIAELMIWDELPGPEPHSNSRCWLDIYHWDGSKMAQCNSLFPQAYEQPKNGFLEICKLYPDQTPEYYYYLGMISEYQAQIERAVEYYEKCAKCAKIPKAYIDAANKRLRHIGSGTNQASSEHKEGHKFWDHQKKPILTVIAGERATQIRQHMAALFVPCSVRERKRAEKALVELISTYKLLENSVEADATWSSPVNFVSESNQHAVVALLHAGTGLYVSVWVLCEEKDIVKSFSFKGSAKGCGYWQVCDDLDADGDAEIIIKHYIGDYDGAGTTAVWPAIYKWDGDSYIRADEHFPDYYAQNVVPKYEKIIEQHKDWQNYDSEQVRTMYEKCRFILQKAKTIAQKRNQNLELLPVLQRIELPGLAVSLGMSVDEVAESFSNIDFTHKPEQRWQRNGHSFWKHEEITCDVVHLRRLNNQLENARFIFENHQLVEVMLTIIDVQNCLKPLVGALDLRQIEPGVYEGLNGQILMRAGRGNAEKQTWEITRK